MKILDRYLVREIVAPFLLALVGLTFVLMLPPIMQSLAQLIAKGVAWNVILRVLLTLVPQALSVTIPMALLYGVLFGLGRWSADREFVALQACGVSVFRILRPIVLLAVLAAVATAYETIVALPDANQTFRQVTFNIVASGAESDIKPRVFYQSFPNRVLYARDILKAGGWREIFLADSTRPDETTAYVAAAGRLIIDRDRQAVTLLLEHGSSYTTFVKKPEECDVHAFERIVLDMDANTVFPRTQIVKGDNEKTIKELRETAALNRERGQPFNAQLYTIQQKFSLPAACLVLALIGLALGASNRKDGKLASFALGTGVVFVYYVLLYTSRAAALAGRISPTIAPWLVNVVLGVAGVALVLWRAGSADQPIRVSLPAFWRRGGRAADGPAADEARAAGPRGGRVVVVIRIPHVNWPRPNLLDLYVARQYLSVFLVSFVALVSIFYIATLIDLADKVLGGVASTSVLIRYFYFATPQYVYYIIPMGALVATLVTVGLLTKNSELIVMRACGISLYRSALPLLLFALTFSGVLFGLQEQVLSESNREAQRLNAIMRGYPMQTVGVLNRQWIIGKSGDIYWYQAFDPKRNQFRQLTIFHMSDAGWQLDQLTYANEVVLAHGTSGEDSLTWQARRGWTRQFSSAAGQGAPRLLMNYQPFAEKPVSLEAPAYFKTDDPDADRMTYAELKNYIAELKASGYHVVPYQVSLQQKLAFPFVAIIMTLIAVPFAVTTGRSGAIYGIGVGLVLAIVYRTALSIFGALGSGGWIDPTLAAWSPNILFGAAAAWMLLTVRT
ncbi:MAG TPA: LptF/LptG family permease [Vicinamibacterales bacterium]|nr:LptF/LptG family permease [Vicinamibacterales bacterium]